MRTGLRVVLDIEVDPASEEQFLTLWHEHAARIRHDPENHGQSLSSYRDQPGRFLVISDWTDEAAFRTFERSATQQAYLTRLWPLRRRGSMTLLDVVADSPAHACAQGRARRSGRGPQLPGEVGVGSGP